MYGARGCNALTDQQYPMDGRLNFLAGDRQKICVDVLLEMLGMYFAVHPYRWKQHPPYFQIGYQRGTEQFAILQL
ncbi:MAG: hypothetical protein UY04_C0016G0005 [Parcubacteria group bacterium GW2011_GWA2_47_7]|nr:MAG: hypothetical protein UY04_C0016G0005 [Parcubacteria group bacterium GW2011_GWA2_47_7]